MNIYEELERAIAENKDVVLCCITETKGSAPRKTGSKMLVFHDRSIIGSVGGGSVEFKAIEDAISVLASGIPQKKYYKLEEDLSMICGGEVEIYFEPVIAKQDLYIFGAGHIGRVVARYALDFGFRITLLDERSGIFDEFENAKFRCMNGDYVSLIESLNFSSKTFSVIVTHKHTYDETVLLSIINKPNAYIGMIGSRRKVAEVKKRFIEEHKIDPEKMDKIDMPIGIPIRGETPEEIAISIIAKIIDVKNSLNS